MCPWKLSTLPGVSCLLLQQQGTFTAFLTEIPLPGWNPRQLRPAPGTRDTRTYLIVQTEHVPLSSDFVFSANAALPAFKKNKQTFHFGNSAMRTRSPLNNRTDYSPDISASASSFFFFSLLICRTKNLFILSRIFPFHKHQLHKPRSQTRHPARSRYWERRQTCQPL